MQMDGKNQHKKDDIQITREKMHELLKIYKVHGITITITQLTSEAINKKS